MWGLRAQIDRRLYKTHMQAELFENTPNLNVVEGSVDNILLDDNNQCTAVLLGDYFILKLAHWFLYCCLF